MRTDDNRLAAFYLSCWSIRLRFLTSRLVNPFPECRFSSPKGLPFRFEISQVRNLLCKMQTVDGRSASAEFLESGVEGRRLRQPCREARRRRLHQIPADLS
jgi:hypothetical protein